MNETREKENGGHGHAHDHHKEITIIVNGRKKEVKEKELSFAQIVELAFGSVEPNPNIVFTITYRPGEGHKPGGTLVEGETVKLKEGMVFNVSKTDKS